MKTIEIVSLKQREDRGGAIVASYHYVLTDDLGMKKSGDGSVGVSRSAMGPDQDAITLVQVHQDIRRKIGFKGVTFVTAQDSPEDRPEDAPMFRRGPGRPPKVA